MSGLMSILVTGGAGYIGSHTVRRLQSDGADVVVLDSLEFGYPQSIPGVPLVVADITDRDAVLATCTDHGVTQAVHFAAYKSVGESMQQPTRYWMNNVAGTVQLVDALLRAGVDQIVFSSSCSVNGTPASVPVTEDMPLAPESIYAETKAMVERILGWYGRPTACAPSAFATSTPPAPPRTVSSARCGNAASTSSRWR